MKNLFFLLVAMATFVSCDTDETTQMNNTQTSSTTLKAGGKCPEGYVEVWEYSFSNFRFKRPIKDCKRGFWFCTIPDTTNWTFIGCRDTSTGEVVLPIDLSFTESGLKVAVYDTPNTPNSVTFLFPKELIGAIPENTIDEFSVFSVDEEIIVGDRFQLIKGQYPTQIINNYIVVNVPIY